MSPSTSTPIAVPGAAAAATDSATPSEEGLVQLVYLSSAHHLLSTEELVDILSVSRRNNAPRNISGLLLYHDGNFIQFLEGPETEVEALYGKIAGDGRHRGVLHLLKRPITKRDFASWTMGFRDLTSAEAEDLDGFNGMMQSLSAPAQLDPGVSRAVQRLIASYRQLWDHGATSGSIPKAASSY